MSKDYRFYVLELVGPRKYCTKNVTLSFSVYDNDEVKFEFPRSIPKLYEIHCTRVSRYHIVEGTIAAVNVTGFDLRAK